MTRSKLSDADKQEITQLFRESDKTIATLASQYEVSSSTIRRLLKRQLDDQEYETLVAAKNSSKSSGKSSSSRTKRTSATVGAAPPVLKPKVKKKPQIAEPSQGELEEQASVTPPELDELIAEIEQDIDEALSSLDDEDGDEDDLEEEDGDEDDGGEEELKLRPEAVVQISPLADAVFPKPCYLVIDRSAELITRPLHEFGDLGHIPETESQSKTLPIFENHRIARRFSQRSQRVIKVPSGHLLQKTGAHLSAKGITRLLMNGRVYAL